MASRWTRIQLQVATDYQGFESLCHDLMIRRGYHDIEPLGGFKDKGRDALHVCKETGKVTIFAYSVREDWENKLEEDLKKIRQHGHACDSIVFVTNQEPTTSQRDSWIDKAKSTYRWDLEFYDLERIGTLIDGLYSELKRLHPNIFVLDASRGYPATDQKKNWTRILSFTQKTPLDNWPKPRDQKRIVRLVASMNLHFLLQATAEVFGEVPAIEMTILFTCYCEADSVLTEIRTHRASLLRAVQEANQVYKTDQDEYWRAWERFKSQWPNIEEARLPVDVKFFPLGIVYNRDARLISIRTDLMRESIEIPRTTDDFLVVLGVLANKEMAAFKELGPAGHPLNKLLCYVADNASVDLGRVRVNADDLDEFDYVYENHDKENRPEERKHQTDRMSLAQPS